MAEQSDPRVLTTMVCVTCGAEQFFAERAPDALTCPRCKSTVFRQFDTPVARDEVTISRLEETARSYSYGDPSPGTFPSEVRDLDR